MSARILELLAANYANVDGAASCWRSTSVFWRKRVGLSSHAIPFGVM